MAASYAARYAALYDLFYRDKPYDKEVAFIHRQLSELGAPAGGRVLELACGTGEHAVRLAKLGYAMTATDGSQAMIALARRKAERRRAGVRFERRDMQKLRAPKLPFDAALCLFDSIGYVKTDSAIAAVIDGVHKSLRPGGIFVLEFWHAPAMLNGYEAVRVRRFRQGKTLFFRVSEAELEPQRSVAHVTYNVYELRANARYNHIRECHTNRYFTVPEMERIAKRHGFTPLAAYDGFQPTAASDESWHVLAIWRKGR